MTQAYALAGYQQTSTLGHNSKGLDPQRHDAVDGRKNIFDRAVARKRTAGPVDREGKSKTEHSGALIGGPLTQVM